MTTLKGAVVYDSVFGNTKLVAEAIAQQIQAEGHSVTTLNLRKEGAKPVQADFMFIGGPTRIKKMTRRVRGYLKKLDKNEWSEKPVIAFDTYGPLGKTEEERRKGDKWVNPGAAGGIVELGHKKGLKIYPDTLRCAVVDLKGPLEPDALDKAKKFTHEFISSLGGAQAAEP
jgi:flavodoxin